MTAGGRRRRLFLLVVLVVAVAAMAVNVGAGTPLNTLAALVGLVGAGFALAGLSRNSR